MTSCLILMVLLCTFSVFAIQNNVVAARRPKDNIVGIKYEKSEVKCDLLTPAGWCDCGGPCLDHGVGIAVYEEDGEMREGYGNRWCLGDAPDGGPCKFKSNKIKEELQELCKAECSSKACYTEVRKPKKCAYGTGGCQGAQKHGTKIETYLCK
jgi:hypothetical protein